MTITLDGIDLEKVESLDVNKNANILPLSMPTKDSDETETFDMLGVTKILTVTGKFVGPTAKDKVDAIEGIADGQQDSSVVFSAPSVLNDTVNVKVASINTTWNIPGFVCVYTIRLLQGK